MVREEASGEVTRDEWKINIVRLVSELSLFLLLPVVISSSNSNLWERKKDIYWAINENQYIS